MMGVSAGAFNFWEIEIESNGILASFSKAKRSTKGCPDSQLKNRDEVIPPSLASEIIEAFQSYLGLNLSQIVYPEVPNPFHGLPSASPYTQKTNYLNMVDGSEGGQTIPLWGQIQPARNPSFIIAWDFDNDAPPYGWNNGTNLYNTYVQANVSNLPFPVVPPYSTFIKQNWIQHPVFFGCNKSLTTTGDSSAPIVLYLSNAPYSAYTNYSGSTGVFSSQQMDDIFLNGFNQLTQGNGTIDEEWPICLGCAAIERSLEKAGMETPDQCQRCFEKYCWDGEVYGGEVSIVDLSLALDPGLGYEEWLSEHEYWNATLSNHV
jgi:lysophospholipase